MLRSLVGSEMCIRDSRKGFNVIYNGKQLLSLATKHEAEAFITKHLRSIGKIGTNDPPPVKARYRPKATKKSKTCGIILRPQSGIYVGSNHDIGSHTTPESAKSALDQTNQDGSLRPKRKAWKSGLRVGRISQLGSATRAVGSKSCAEVLKRWRFFCGIRRTTCTETPSRCDCFSTISLPR